MNYRFEISLPNSSDFRCEIAIDGDQTFQQLHDKIIEILGYDGSQMASFFTLNKMGNRVKEIALMDMSVEDEDSDTLVMDVTMIREIVNANCIELEYVYDFFNNRYFKVEYAGEYIADSADILPVCLYCDGDIPEQVDFNSDDDWEFDKPEEEYDSSFMNEFSNDYDEDDDNFREGGGGYDDEEEADVKYDDQYESLDDYIDKL